MVDTTPVLDRYGAVDIGDVISTDCNNYNTRSNLVSYEFGMVDTAPVLDRYGAVDIGYVISTGCNNYNTGSNLVLL